MKNQTGFTLVELAIVLMIIGLLIGAVLRGQELMENARLQNVSKQITSYTGAIVTFRDTYAGYPGDILTAPNRIPGCQTGNTNNCVGGNGNGMIGTATLVYNLGTQTVASENMQFWKHLALTHLISGVDPSAATPVFGKSHPFSPIGGGMSVITSLENPAQPEASVTTGTLVIRLHNSITSGALESNPTMSPKQASYIDRKMDDGIPDTGDVQANGNGTQPDCEKTYKLSNENKICVMSFLINR